MHIGNVFTPPIRKPRLTLPIFNNNHFFIMYLDCFFPGLIHALKGEKGRYEAALKSRGRSVKSKPESYVGTQRARQPGKGFTLIEFAVTTVIVMVVSSMAVMMLMPTWRQNQSLVALDIVKSTLRQARETAIAQRRTIVVTFTGNNTINLFQVAEPSNTVSSTAYLSVPLAGKVQFMTYAGETQTPDNSAAAMPTVPAGINFPGAVGNMQFNSDGSFSDSTGTPTTGTVFLEYPNMPGSAAAVTIMGTTGRVRSYRTAGTGWWR